jgi:CBS domain-containing protein
MKAGELMTTGAATIRPESSLAEAARLMLEYRISGLPVVDAEGKLVGLISESDFLRPNDKPYLVEALGGDAKRAAGELNARRVADLMTRDPVTIGLETPLSEIVALLSKHDIRRMPVVSQGKVVGIVSRANLLEALFRRALAGGQPQRT